MTVIRPCWGSAEAAPDDGNAMVDGRDRYLMAIAESDLTVLAPAGGVHGVPTVGGGNATTLRSWWAGDDGDRAIRIVRGRRLQGVRPAFRRRAARAPEGQCRGAEQRGCR